MPALEPKPYLKEISIEPERTARSNEYPFDIPAVAKLGVLRFHPDVTFFVGENGTGKSTILEAVALAMGFGPEGGTRNMLFNTADTVSTLHEYLRINRSFRRPNDGYFLRAESFYNVATYTDEVGYLGGYDNIPLHRRSHGEAFLVLLNRKLRGDGFYVFDEPEAALSPTRQMSALASIHRLVRARSQFIIATHSPILLAYPNSKIVQFGADGVREVQYEDTEHFAVTKRFLNDYRRLVDRLLRDE